MSCKSSGSISASNKNIFRGIVEILHNFFKAAFCGFISLIVSELFSFLCLFMEQNQPIFLLPSLISCFYDILHSMIRRCETIRMRILNSIQISKKKLTLKGSFTIWPQYVYIIPAFDCKAEEL